MKRRADSAMRTPSSAPAGACAAALVAALTALPSHAQSAPQPAPAAPPELVHRLAPSTPEADPANLGEPAVAHTVIEDNGSKIDQLTVRGHVQHVVVTPKVGITKPYEILLSPEGREPYYGTGGAGSATGKRVWNVLNF